MAHILPDGKALEERVAELEATVERLAHPLVTAEFPPLSDEDAARFKTEFDAAMQDFQHQPPKILPSSLRVLDPESVRQLLRECVTVVKPGEVLVIRVHENTTPNQLREQQAMTDTWTKEHAPGMRVMLTWAAGFAVAEGGTDEPSVS